MNGYFRLIHEEGKTGIQLIPPTEGGDAVSVNDVTEYLALKDIVYDKNLLYKAIAASAEKKRSYCWRNVPRFRSGSVINLRSHLTICTHMSGFTLLPSAGNK